MKNILVENKFGHGAIFSHPYIQEIKDIFIGKTSISGFDWSKGIIGRTMYPVKNQDKAFSCGWEFLSRAIQIKTGKNISAKSGYSQNFSSGGGMNLSQIESSSGYIGSTSEASVPSNKPDGSCDEPFMEDVSWKNDTKLKESISNAGYDIVYINTDIDSTASAIQKYGAVGMLIVGQNNGTWQSSNPLPPSNNSGLWGHYMCYTSNIPAITPATRKVIPAYQSWGIKTGDNGIQYFGEDYFNSGYIYSIIALTPHYFNSDISYGMGGAVPSNEVKFLQRYLGIIPTGYFGTITKNAVIAYQKANGISQTGYVGPITRTAINKDLKTKLSPNFD
jgi:peptidoglycan hydrolase-like protein with peptidoglycan-binding domain